MSSNHHRERQNEYLGLAYIYLGNKMGVAKESFDKKKSPFKT